MGLTCPKLRKFLHVRFSKVDSSPCYSPANLVLLSCYSPATLWLPLCYSPAIMLLWLLSGYSLATLLLLSCYSLVTLLLLSRYSPHPSTPLQLGPYYYEFGRHLTKQCPVEGEAVGESVANTFKARFKMIVDSSQVVEEE